MRELSCLSSVQKSILPFNKKNKGKRLLKGTYVVINEPFMQFTSGEINNDESRRHN